MKKVINSIVFMVLIFCVVEHINTTVVNESSSEKIHVGRTVTGSLNVLQSSDKV